ncbi:MAG: selenocysteine-specific translation elongation factor [Proteobacteria bacterium]|nr:selenocysteine-specific translation elongation factor [Pseudomonadota bacterium]
MKRVILGTAGHIDHGKTTFIKAITGIDCDRLKEEKERGITIELGYAHLTLPTGIKIGIVDVPGHEKFVSKMVAGASGIDIVAFIISAEEGIKPQTREHLYICELLGVKKGIVVVTKKDLVDDDFLSLQLEDIKNFIEGTFLENSKIIPVSSITGDGLDDFLKELERLSSEITEKPSDKPFRLPIDDIVTIKGFGTVVRGTIISGTVSVKDEVVLLPTGYKSRIRSIQSHNQNITTGYAGERVALNLPEIGKEEIERGMLVAKEGYFEVTDKLLVEFFYLPYNQKPLKSRFVSQFHIYTNRVEGEFFLINREKLNPGERSFAVIRLKKPVYASYGDPFIVRGFGVYTTMGGGKIINPALATINRNISEEYLKKLATAGTNELIELFLREKKKEGITIRKLSGIINMAEKDIETCVAGLLSSEIVFKDSRERLYHSAGIDDIKRQIIDNIEDFHKKNPLKIGMNKGELFEKISVNEGLFETALSILIKDKKLEIDGNFIKTRGINKSDSAIDPLFVKIESYYRNSGLQPDDNIPELTKKLGVTERVLKDILVTLIKKGTLIRIKDNYYIHEKVFEDLKQKILNHFGKKDLLTPQDMKEIFNLSRKYTIPILEYLDSIKFTIRLQEGRKLRNKV